MRDPGSGPELAKAHPLPIAFYLSSVEGKLVARYSTQGRGRRALWIGAKRTDKGIEWDTKAVLPLPQAEYLAHKREYDRAMRDGSVRVRTEAEYRGWLADREKERAVKLAAFLAEQDKQAAPPAEETTAS